MKSQLIRMVALVLLVFALAGCMNMSSFSAEDAAVRSGMQSFQDSIDSIDQNSVEIRQVRDEGETKYVLYTFNRKMVDHDERCMMMFKVDRTAFRTWIGGSGGGGCSSMDQPMENLPAVEAGVGNNSGQDDPNGYSYANGFVNMEEIVRVRVTWADGVVIDADVINETYLVMRDGQHSLSKVEGLDVEGNVIGDNSVGVAPGKEE